MPSYQEKKELKQDRMEAYFNWMMVPPAEREPQTKLEFASIIGISPQTLYSYEKDPDFRRKVSNAKEELSTRWYGDIMGRLKTIVDTGAEGNAINAAKLLLQHLSVPQDESLKLRGIDIEAIEAAIQVIKLHNEE